MRFSDITIFFSTAVAVFAVVNTNSCPGIIKLSHDLSEGARYLDAQNASITGMPKSADTSAHREIHDESIYPFISGLHRVEVIADDIYAMDTDGKFDIAYPGLREKIGKIKHKTAELESHSLDPQFAGESIDHDIIIHALDVMSNFIGQAKKGLKDSHLLAACANDDVIAKRQVIIITNRL
ncbi:hypothetical protein BDV59DRAFT_119991 [Aspergillus ambiguus]|uniref:uncharacterized protein n=1 Tax=Aspergillus ambiguus TaxID=176160 RepID=UPI003CCCF7CE